MCGLLTLSQGKRLFIKDITYYLVPPDGKTAAIAPSLARKERGVGTNLTSSKGAQSNGTSAEGHQTGIVNGNENILKIHPYPYNTDAEPENPTVIPKAVLEKFHFTFLIRHPRSSIPSYFRCTIPPLDSMTGFYDFMPNEAGYDELRRVFDYLRSVGQVGPGIAGKESNGPGNDGDSVTNGHPGKVDICVVDADDLLDNPSGIIEAYCKSVGLKYDPQMLKWNSEEDHNQAREAFEKWKGFHEDAMNSSELRPRLHVSIYFSPFSSQMYGTSRPLLLLEKEVKLYQNGANFSGCKKKKVKSVEEEDQEWRAKYGEKGAKVIRETVEANVKDYEYLKQFALKV